MNTKFDGIYLDFIQFCNQNIIVLYKDPLTILLNLYLNISIFFVIESGIVFKMSSFNFPDSA